MAVRALALAATLGTLMLAAGCGGKPVPGSAEDAAAVRETVRRRRATESRSPRRALPSASRSSPSAYARSWGLTCPRSTRTSCASTSATGEDLLAVALTAHL